MVKKKKEVMSNRGETPTAPDTGAPSPLPDPLPGPTTSGASGEADTASAVSSTGATSKGRVESDSKGKKKGKGRGKVTDSAEGTDKPIGKPQPPPSVVGSGEVSSAISSTGTISKTGGESTSKPGGKGKKKGSDRAEAEGKQSAESASGAPAKSQTPSSSLVLKSSGSGLWKEISSEGPHPPRRPTKDYSGTAGRRIKLITNHFEVKINNPDIVIYHYDVTIKDHRNSETLPRRKKMKVFEALKASYPKVFNASPMGYDSVKNAYSIELIPQLLMKKGSKPAPYSVEVQMDEGDNRRSKFNVSVVKVGEAYMKDLLHFIQGRKMDMPMTLIQMIEIMFRHYRCVKYEQVSGRNFFSLLGEFGRPTSIGNGKEGISGFFGSLRPTCWKDGSILLNIDMANTAFYKEQPVIDFIKDQDKIRFFNEGQIMDQLTCKDVNKLLKGLKIRVTHAPRTYRFNKVHPQGADKTTFTLKDESGASRRCTVQEYMRMQYGIMLKFPRLNCLHVGNVDKDIYIPMELCGIAKGQRVMKKLSDREASVFIRSTAIPPHERLQKIQNIARTNNFNTDPMLRALSFSISDSPLQTDGRVLPAPGLKMDKNFVPREGQWDMRDKRFFAGAQINLWAVINYDFRTRMDDVRKFIFMMQKMAQEKGMTMGKPFDFYDCRDRNPRPIEDLKHYKGKYPDIQLIVCVLPGRSKIYGAIKKAGDTEIGIITQCVQGMNVQKCNNQTIGNLLLKINAKMGGTNNIVSLENSLPLVTFGRGDAGPYMIMGADVNHPPAGGDKSIPSISAVVGSYDRFATKYAVERRTQFHRVEMIQDLKEITKNLLINFYKNVNLKPKRIIMYRDGVSESQFFEVLSAEMLAMREACNILEKGYEPGITFICVQKRHHTRLFCCDQRDAVGRSGNVPPGTIVDKNIIHPSEIDFYLCSHQGIQGTSRPTHYHLLWDDNDIPLDELQQLTYRLCHVYTRCNKSVSIPAPVYYAHLAAFRAKVYIGEFLDESDAGSVTSDPNPDLERIQHQITLTTNIFSSGEMGQKLHYI